MNWRHVLVLAAVTLLAMGIVLRNGFVDWDDPHTIRDNPNLNPPTFDGLLNQWTAPLGGLYVPLTYTLWWMTAQFAHGQTMAALPFHALSLMTHVLSAIALLYLIRRLVADDLAALIGAMVFAVHPLQTEAVAWASGYKDVLCGLLSIVAVGQYVAFVQTTCSSKYLCAIIAMVAALLAKPQAVVVPAIMIAIDWIVLRRGWIEIARSISPMIPLAIAWMVLTAIVQDTAGVSTQIPFLQRPLVAIDSVAFYLIKLGWPAGLAPDYARTPQYIVRSSSIAYTWLLPTLAAALIAASRSRLIITGAIAFVLSLGPVLGFATFLFQDFSNVADHYMYLPMAGVGVIVAAICRQLPARVTVVAAALLLPILTIVSAVQLTHWRSSQSLFTHNLKVNPGSSVATNNIAFTLLDTDLEAAERLARRAIDLKPNNADAMVNLANALARQNQPKEAATVLEQAVALRPKMVEARASLAGAYGELGRFDDARRECEIALRLEPQNRQAKFIWSLLQQVPTTASTRPQ